MQIRHTTQHLDYKSLPQLLLLYYVLYLLMVGPEYSIT
jgi:hypothetical protein